MLSFLLSVFSSSAIVELLIMAVVVVQAMRVRLHLLPITLNLIGAAAAEISCGYYRACLRSF
jgi:hypothetical protein